jgi:NAD(P)H-dependent flavin oxidoreductase YrpB (nitropropane dioxygenase family)
MVNRWSPFFESIQGALVVKRLLNLSWGAFIGLSMQMMKADEGSPIWVQARQGVGTVKHLKAIEDGDVDGGILFAGQCCGGIDDIPTCKEVIDRVVSEAEETLDKMNRMRA